MIASALPQTNRALGWLAAILLQAAARAAIAATDIVLDQSAASQMFQHGVN